MPAYSFFDPATGLLDARWYSGPDDALVLNTPAGMTPIQGHHDRNRVRVNVMTGELVPYQPPAPPDTEWASHSWDAESWAWVSAPTDAALARDARADRDRRLSACDWVVARAIERAELVPVAWATYREALRDVPEQPGFPRLINWPTPPSA